MKKIFFLPLLIILSLINSCKTDFDVNADWKDISVVYCLLNPKDSVHYVKLNKCFLGDESAYVMAQISDSSNYANANVKLISGTLKSSGEFLEDENSETILLEKTYEVPKAPGYFNSETNVLYRTPGNSTYLELEKDYKLVIEIPGKETIESYTSLISIDDLSVTKPFSSFNLSEIGVTTVEWKSIENAKLYEFAVLFTYVEIYNNESTIKTIKWAQKSKESKHIDGNESMSASVKGDQFLQYISSVIKNDPNYKEDATRYAYSYVINQALPSDPRNKFPLQLYFYTGTEDLNTYIQVSQPSSTIVQEKPSFSNVSNGLGIFSCRANKTIKNKQLNEQTIEDIHSSSYTFDLNFGDIYQTATYWSENE